MLGLIIVALSVGLSNFAASVAIGVGGANARTRWRVGVVFGIFEAGMPVAGLLVGEHLAGSLGSASHWLGATLLIAVGAYGAYSALRESGTRQSTRGSEGWRLPLFGLVLSLDNLTVGFALGTYHVNLAIAVVIFGGVSVVLSLLGLELGGRLGSAAAQRGELLGALILIGAGAAILSGV